MTYTYNPYEDKYYKTYPEESHREYENYVEPTECPECDSDQIEWLALVTEDEIEWDSWLCRSCKCQFISASPD